MKNILKITVLAILFFSCDSNVRNNAIEDADLTEGITMNSPNPVISIAEFDLKAGEYVDEVIQISGIVDHVCEHGGKKLKLVTDDGMVHVVSDERFNDTLVGNEIVLNGIVRELRIDEGSCLQMEEDNIKNNEEGKMESEQFENKKKQIESYRNSMKTAGTDHLSFYSLEFVSMEEVTNE